MAATSLARSEHPTPEPAGAHRTPIRTRGKPDDVDRHVGRMIRQRRVLVGLSQGKLGELVGIGWQQVQVYERGSNRIGADRLLQFANALGVSVSYFFEGLDGAPPPGHPAAAPDQPADPSPLALQLLREFEKLPPHRQVTVREMIRSVAMRGSL